MKQPDEILSQVRTRYQRSWRDWLLGEAPGPMSWSLNGPTAEEFFREPAKVNGDLLGWRRWAADHPLVSLRRRTLRTRLGEQESLTHLEVPDVEALLSLDSALQRHWRTANSRLETLAGLGSSPYLLRPLVGQIVELPEPDFTILVDASRWFAVHPASGYTVRQVPVPGMHTKWLARHRRLVLAALNLASDVSDGSDDLSQIELDPLGLRALPQTVDLILADPTDRQRHGGLRHVQAPVPEVSALHLQPAHVLVVENKESAMIVPDVPGLVVIHSLGNNLEPLLAIPWLKDADCWYWGDLDRAGMTLLSRARTKIPRIKSLLMDSATLDAHKWLAVQEQEKADRPGHNLDEDELIVAARLWTGGASYMRLEQERVAPDWVLEAITHAIQAAGVPDQSLLRGGAGERRESAGEFSVAFGAGVLVDHRGGDGRVSESVHQLGESGPLLGGEGGAGVAQVVPAEV